MNEKGAAPPAEFEEYRLIQPLGKGGMGQVYLAEDRLLARLVAVKFIAAASPTKAARERFFMEARALARLSHPHVVAVHRVGEIRGQPFLVSEYVRGRDLAQVEKPLPWEAALLLAVDLARGLGAAHRRGVLHRDIKPANAVISEDGAVKLLDFGLAELVPEGDPAEAALSSDGAAATLVAGGAPAAPGEGAASGGRPAPGGQESTVDLPPPSDAGLLPTATLTGAPAERTLASPGEPRPGAAEQVTVTAAPGGDAELGAAAAPTVSAAPAVPAASAASAVPTVTAPPGAPGARRRPRGASPRVAGTPLYMAPEIWRGEPASPRADVYALGVVMYELCAGETPHGVLPPEELRRAALEVDAPPLAGAAPSIDARFAAVVDRCLRRDPALRFPDGDALREALEQLAAQAPAPGAVPEGNPYRGLLAFEAEHRGLFFGRSAEILGILERLRADPFVLVAGDSGTGKSSLCRAGVLPAAGGRALEGVSSVVTVVLGRQPLAALAAAIAPLLESGEGGEGSEAAVLERLRAEPGALARDIQRRRGGVLLFIDQLEELCTFVAPAEAEAAAEALHGLVDRAGGVRVLATARSDFLTRLSALPGLGDDLPAALYLLRPLDAARLREAVTGPAAVKGVAFESEAMVETLVGEAQRAEGGLPLLQFALAELWEARDEARAVIPESALEAIGGVSGALARHADGVLANLPPPHRAAAQAMLLALVTAEGTRARRSEGDLLDAAGAAPGARAALEALVRGRLLVAGEAEEGAGSAYAIAHEALLTGWDTLRGWLSHDAEDRALRQRLERAAAEWERLGRSGDALWGGRLLGEVARLSGRGLGAREAAFLEASRRAARRQRVGRWAAALAVPLAIALALVGARVQRARELDARVDEAREAVEEARRQRVALDDLRQAAFARYDAGDEGEAEKVWAEALKQRAAVERAYANVCGGLELALQQDAGHRRARALLVDALYERAMLADRDGRAAEREELTRQLRVHEQGAPSRWDAPARLSVQTTPPGAEVTIERYRLDDGRWKAEPEGAPGSAPVVDRALAPGSIRLTFSAPGRATVQLPLLLERGEERRVAVELPAAAAVPEGFVYIPPGRFLYGSASETARAMFESQPLHAIEMTRAYLIARSETTFEEWIAYLRSLPAKAPAKRAPEASRTGIIIALEELKDGDYQLKLGPEKDPYVARTGKPIQYKGRQTRAVQSWLQMPVTGISFEEAQGYLAWLDETGRVRGARACTEQEWERAARGADGRTYPASQRLEPDDANHDLTYNRNRDGPAFGPDAVGAHPGSDSPFGIHDMAGNVWEWTVTGGQVGTPVARGGGYFQGTLAAHVENRALAEPQYRDAFYGLRVCASPGVP